ncbi:hypothetical protein ACFWY9_19665 [Amycolatopsis sp. NPDC059027]|uniref:hypothetical protein n=1 Tax=Amycolatopsis sp. NPDC059027 TaxID=3346709 RepID=UPI0036724E22
MLHNGVPVATHVILSHDEQLERLRQSCPPAVERAVVAGDPCLDRLQASLLLRESHRQALGVRPAQRLIVLSSTWGGKSLFGRTPDLPRKLAEHLPLDSYRLVLALHPNIGQGHSSWQLERWLDDCRNAGVHVLPTEDLWQSALVAADLTIGDHGSVTFYSACLGTPLLLAEAPEDAVDPDSPIARLLRRAPRLGADPLDSIEQTITDHDPRRYADITELATSLPGKSAEALRALLYQGMNLPPPPRAAAFPTLPLPALPAVTPSALSVRVTAGAVTRYPATPQPRWDDAQLVVHADGADAGLLELADVVIGAARTDPLHWAGVLLRALPGCQWVATPSNDSSWLAASASGLVVELTADGVPDAFVSLLAASDTAPPPELRLDVAGHVYTAKVRTIRSAGP